MKTIDLSESVYQIVTDFPEVSDIMVKLGFKDITNPAILNTAGRYVTLPKGAKMKKIPMMAIEKAFLEQGFELIGAEE